MIMSLGFPPAREVCVCVCKVGGGREEMEVFS